MPKKQGKIQKREIKTGKCQMWKTLDKNQLKTEVLEGLGE